MNGHGGRRIGAGMKAGHVRLLTAADRAEIVRRYIAGEPGAQIAKDYRISESYPAVLAKRCNMQRPESWPQLRVIINDVEEPIEEMPLPAAVMPSVVAAEPAEVLRLHARGVGLTGIAALTRLPYARIKQIVDLANERKAAAG